MLVWSASMPPVFYAQAVKALNNYRQFSDDGEHLYVFDKLAGKAFKSSIRDAGSEKHFNTLDVDGRRINLEERFSDLDGRLAELVQMLDRDRRIDHLSSHDRYDLAFLAVVQLLRVKVQRTTLMSLPAQVAASFADLGIPNHPALVGTIDENQAKLISLRMLVDAPTLAQALVEKNWSLHLAPPESPLWISDCPIVMDNEFEHGDLGLACEGVRVFWPVSRSVILGFACPMIANNVELTNAAQARTRRRNPTFACGAAHVDFFNRLQVTQSGRFIYGPSADFAIAVQVLSAHPQLKHVTSKTRVAKMGQAPRNDRMPPGKWLVVFGGRTSHRCPIQSWADVDGELRVCVSIDGWEALKQILEDAPYTQIGIFQDGSHTRHMREVLIAPVPGRPTTVVISHADRGVRAIMRDHARRDRSDSKSNSRCRPMRASRPP